MTEEPKQVGVMNLFCGDKHLYALIKVKKKIKKKSYPVTGLGGL
jgi:hypothetical protein